MDAETLQILRRLNRKALNVPCYEFGKVNFSLILMLLSKERMTLDDIAAYIGAKSDTVKKWCEAVNRPRCGICADKVVALGMNYLSAEKMAECGVTV